MPAHRPCSFCRSQLDAIRSWRAKMTDEWLRTQLVSDTHAPHASHVDGIVRNTDAWYGAFGPTDALYLPPEKRVRLW